MSNENNNRVTNLTRRIDDIFRRGGLGGRSSINSESMYGLNMINRPPPTTPNQTNSGIVFFTRPLLNLTYDNLNRMETLIPWRDSDEYSVARYTRVMLDPISQIYKNRSGLWHVNTSGDPRNDKFIDRNRHQFIDCPLVDSKNPFIPILTNNLLSLSGYQDTRLDHYASDKGIMNEQWIMADGISEHNESYSLDATFYNPNGDQVLMLFDLWTKYMDYVRRGELWPHPMMLVNREIDYMTRIYNFALDSSRRYLTHWSSTGGGGFPTGVSNGKVFDYSNDKIFKDGLDNINISFQCVGLDYNLVSTLMEFNDLVGMYNSDLRLDYGPSWTPDYQNNIPYANYHKKDANALDPYIKLLPHEIMAGNYHAYPLINLFTKELEWWMPIDDYLKYVRRMKVKASDIEKDREERYRSNLNTRRGPHSDRVPEKHPFPLQIDRAKTNPVSYATTKTE